MGLRPEGVGLTAASPLRVVVSPPLAAMSIYAACGGSPAKRDRGSRRRRLLPADRYLLPIASYAPRTKILRFAQNDCVGREANPVTSCVPLRGMPRSGKGCTTWQVEMIRNADLAAKRQPSRQSVFNADCLICTAYQDSSLSLRMTVSGGKAHNVYFKLRRQPPPQPSAGKAVKLKNPPAHRAGQT